MNRRRSAVRVSALVLGMLAVHARVQAQAGAGLGDGLRVEPSADGCVTLATLEPRVRRWLDAQARRGVIAVAVHAGGEPPAFSVLRDGKVIARRSFDVLPAACSDRLDAIAVAVAVAIEHATSGRMARAASERRGERAAGQSTRPAPAQTAPARGEPAPVPPAPAPAAPPDAQPPPPPTAPEADAEPEVGPEPNDERAPDEAAPAEGAENAEDAQDAVGAGASAGVGVRLFAGVALLAEVLPEAAFALGAGAELEPSPLLRVAAAALFTLPSEGALAGGTFQSQLLAARAHVCLGRRFAADALDLEGCGGGAAGLVLASGDDFEQDHDVTLGWAALVLRAALRYPASAPISLRFALDGLVHALQPALEVEVPGEPAAASAEAGPVGAAGSLELVIALP